MATWLVFLLFSVGALLIFVVGLSLTLIFKGHNIDSEIATNKHMQARGITCAARDARGDHEALVARGEKKTGPDCADLCSSDHNCSSCV